MTYLVLVVAAGLGLAGGGIVYLTTGRLVHYAPVQLQRKQPRVGKRTELTNVRLPGKMLIWLLAGALGGLLLGIDSAAWPVITLAGGMVGIGLHIGLKRVHDSQQRFARLKEVAILYESVDLYARAGFTVRQSLQMSLILLSQLRPVIEKTLDRWPYGPLRAIQQMGDEISMPEADMLTGILMHAEECGAQKIAGIMEEEAGRLEKLRQCMAETRMAAKPLYTTMYIFLPLIAALGILIAPVAYRAINMISGIKSMN